jgi:hypothetical protein
VGAFPSIRVETVGFGLVVGAFPSTRVETVGFGLVVVGSGPVVRTFPSTSAKTVRVRAGYGCVSEHKRENERVRTRTCAARALQLFSRPRCPQAGARSKRHPQISQSAAQPTLISTHCRHGVAHARPSHSRGDDY